MSTVPGMYRWTDCGYRARWRLQVHYAGGTYRLLDPDGRVARRGSENDCREELRQITRRLGLQRSSGRLIVLVHGLARNAWSMGSIARFLQKACPADDVVLYQYASTAGSVDGHARRFIQFMDFATEAEEVHFVAHSLGNIVLRRAYRLAQEQQWTMPRIRKHVMLGPPNQGAQIARRLVNFIPVCWFTGAPFMELGRDWSTFSSALAVPPCTFGIIAGRVAWLDRFHPFISDPNDAFVRVEETHLDGAADFLEVAVPHNWLMNSPQVHRATYQFLKSGRFCDEQAAQRLSATARLQAG